MGSERHSLPTQPVFSRGNSQFRRFDFARDTFAFPNELLWEYELDQATGQTTCRPRQPRPDYTLRCFVLARAVKQFFLHARFDAALPEPDDQTCRALIRRVVRSNPRARDDSASGILFPGYPSLREFSASRRELLKAECGGAWRSYVLRSHWRMVFPLSRGHQARTARRIAAKLQADGPAIIHLVQFPSLSINHGMVLYDVTEGRDQLRFAAYDPNDPEKPTELFFQPATRTFSLARNRYWAGGELNVIEIYRNWFF